MKYFLILGFIFFQIQNLIAIQKVFLSDRGTQKVLVTNDILDTSGSTQTKRGGLVVSSLTANGASLFDSTVTVDTGKFRIIHVSTIVGNSPINFISEIHFSSSAFFIDSQFSTGTFDQVITSTISGKSPLTVNNIRLLNFDDGSSQITAVISTGQIQNRNTLQEGSTFFVSSGTVNQLNIGENLSMGNNKHFYSSDRNTYVFFDTINNFLRFFLNSVEMYRLEN